MDTDKAEALRKLEKMLTDEELLCMIGIHNWKENSDGIRVCGGCCRIHHADYQKVRDL
jgi:S-methylmethionine-dependent homocysteine/selenocysteine methylase